MKTYCLLLILSLFLCGCKAEETFETVSDEIVSPVMSQPRQIAVRLPDDAVSPVLESEARQIYMSEEYEITIETLSSGDLNATVQSLTGYEIEQLTVMETGNEDVKRYDFVWVSTGDLGECLGQAVILDDGEYHYCMSVLRDAGKRTQIVWSDVFSSFTLI